MLIGVTLPSLSADATGVLDAAKAAEDAGLHGVFCFDHLWPLGHPERPSLALYPLLGAVAAVTERVRVGSLVARVGLLPDEVVAASLESVQAISGSRLIAGLGTGDDASAPEHLRNGIPVLGTASRVSSLAAIAERLAASQIECWIGAGSLAVNDAARTSGVALNLWGVDPERVAAARARSAAPVTWGGPLPSEADEAAAALRALADAGAAWVVWGWPQSIGDVVEAARRADIAL